MRIPVETGEITGNREWVRDCDSLSNGANDALYFSYSIPWGVILILKL